MSMIVGVIYIGQLLVKAVLAKLYAQRMRNHGSQPSSEEITIVQPILSGDPALFATLEANLQMLPSAVFIWLVDINDPLGATICEGLAARYQGTSINIVRCCPPAQGVNPKTHKLAIGLSQINTREFVVLDDDTRLTVPALHALIQGLNDGATLSTGLPRYQAAEGHFSRWLAEFVNSAAVLTYLPMLTFSEAISIHGMCYAMRTSDARRLDVFHAIGRALTDDLALAGELSRRHLRIHQTVEPHDIATSVPSLFALGQILHRWFVFTRLLLGQCSWSMRWGIAASYAVPPLLLMTLFGCAWLSPGPAGILIVTLLGRELILRWVKRGFLGPLVPNSPIVSVVLEFAQPALLAAAYFGATIRWRTRIIRVRTVDSFEYV